MPLTHDAAERLFYTGEFEELVRSTDLAPHALQSLELSHRALVAHALALVGDFKTARRVILSIDEAQQAPLFRSKVQLIIGLIDEGSGAMRNAHDHFQLAVRLASISKEESQLAWAQLRLFRHMMGRSPASVVAGMLPEVRRAVTRAGSAQVTAYLHQCVSILEGQLGRIDEARRHCDIVDSLLSNAPNAWLLGSNLMNRACLAMLECDFQLANRYLANARKEMTRSGALLNTSNNNVGHCQILTGEFDRAVRSCHGVLESERASHLAVLGAFEGLARLYLALDKLGDCERALDRIDAEVQRDPALAHTFHIRWAAITKARFLLKSGRSREAERLLEEVGTLARGSGDAPLETAVELTMAQAQAASGNLSSAARRLLVADRRGVTSIRELQAPHYFGSALVIRDMSPWLAGQLRERAFRLWKRQGVVSVPLEMSGADDGGRTRPAGRESSVIGDSSVSAASVVDAIAAVFDLAHTPELMAQELLDVIETLDCSQGARLANVGPPSVDDERDADTIAISLGLRGGRPLSVLCPVPNAPDKAVLLGDISRIASAAVSLERARADERGRSAIWPAEPVEEEAGALFMAEEMQSLLATVRRVAATNVPVLITGETGTGKEVLARTIHGYSNRTKAPFLPFNCTSTPKDLLDSQLFGHRRGSFSGAVENFQGIIRAASGGTLFLDEIGDMALEVQPKLLRFLESSEVHPVGETHSIRADVRVVVATNADLESLVSEGRFREDLFYRLNIVHLRLPPLRERRVEIPAFATHYLQRYAQEFGKGDLRIAEETMEYLVLYRWPGNVRQLANEMRRMAALYESGAVLMPEHLSDQIAVTRRTVPASQRVLDPTEVVVRLDQPLAAAAEHIERAMIQYALKRTGGHMEEAAALLGLSRKGLYLKRQRFGIQPPDASPAIDVA